MLDANAGEAPSKEKADKFDDGETFIMVHGPFLADPTLSDAQSKYLIVLESWLWENDNCWPGDAMIARRAGWLQPDGKPNSEKASRVGRTLEKKGRILRILRKGPDGRDIRDRIDVFGLRPIHRVEGARSPQNDPGSIMPPPGVKNDPSRYISDRPGGQKCTGEGLKMTPELDVLELDSGNQTQQAECVTTTTLHTQSSSSSAAALSREGEGARKDSETAIITRSVLDHFGDNPKNRKSVKDLCRQCGPAIVLEALDITKAKAAETGQPHGFGYFFATARNIKAEGGLVGPALARADVPVEDEFDKLLREDREEQRRAEELHRDRNAEPGVKLTTLPAAIASPVPAVPVAPAPVAQAKPRRAAKPRGPVPPGIPPRHWVIGVRDRIADALEEVAGQEAVAEDRKKLKKVARQVQMALTRTSDRETSKSMLVLVEAVAYGYPLEKVEAVVLRAGSNQPSDTFHDISLAITTLDPKPREWLRDLLWRRDCYRSMRPPPLASDADFDDIPT